MTTEVAIGPVRVGGGHPLALIAGPGVIESRRPLLQLGARLVRIAGKARTPLVLTASFDKADRMSHRSARAAGALEATVIAGSRGRG